MFSLVILSRQVCFSPRTMALLHLHRWILSFPLFFLVLLLSTSVTNRLYWCFRRQFFPGSSYFHHISSGVPAVPHHFQCGGVHFQEEVQDALLPLPHGRDILVLNEKSGSAAEATTGGGRGWRRTTRKLPQIRRPSLMPEPWPRRPNYAATSRTRKWEAPKENLLAAVAAPAEAVTVGIIYANTPK